MRQVLPLSCHVMPFGARTACLAWDIEEATTARRAIKKTSHVYILRVPSPPVFMSSIRSLGRSLLRFEGGREGRQKGWGGCAAPAPPGAHG